MREARPPQLPFGFIQRQFVLSVESCSDFLILIQFRSIMLNVTVGLIPLSTSRPSTIGMGKSSYAKFSLKTVKSEFLNYKN